MKNKLLEEKIFKVIMVSAAIVILTVLLYIIGTVLYKGALLTWDMIANFRAADFIWERKGRFECNSRISIHYSWGPCIKSGHQRTTCDVH
jgi:ABC-type phosphate transport system permease subunit